MNQVHHASETRQLTSALSQAALARAYGTVFWSAVGLLLFVGEVAYPLVLNQPPVSWWLLLVPFPGLLLFLCAFVPGNLAALLPFSIEVSPQEGIRLGIPFRKVWIPIRDVVDVDVSSTTLFWRKSYEVEWTQSHGLIPSFYISPAFGKQRDVLVEAIRRALNERGSN